MKFQEDFSSELPRGQCTGPRLLLLATAWTCCLLLAGCGSGPSGYSAKKVAPLVRAQQIPLVVDLAKTKFSGSAFPEEKQAQAREQYKSATAALFARAFAAAGMSLQVKPVAEPPQDGDYLVAVVNSLDASSTGTALAGVALQGVLGGSFGVGQTGAELQVRVFDKGKRVLQSKYSCSSSAAVAAGSVMAASLASEDAKILSNPGAKELYCAICLFAIQVSESYVE